MPAWIKDLLTGSDNRTLAIGRFMGVVLLVMIVMVPVVEVGTVLYKELEIHQWGEMLDQWQVFMPIMIGSAVGVIAGTAFTEPRGRKPDEHEDHQ